MLKDGMARRSGEKGGEWQTGNSCRPRRWSPGSGPTSSAMKASASGPGPRCSGACRSSLAVCWPPPPSLPCFSTVWRNRTSVGSPRRMCSSMSAPASRRSISGSSQWRRRRRCGSPCARRSCRSPSASSRMSSTGTATCPNRSTACRARRPASSTARASTTSSRDATTASPSSSTRRISGRDPASPK